MRIAVTGSSGMVGSALVSELRSAGHSVSRLTRESGSVSSSERRIQWNPANGTIHSAGLEGHEAVVHLAGERIFGRWTTSRKRAIRESRVRGTSLLSRTIAGLRQPPRVLVSASAVGFYGDRAPDEIVDEQSPGGSGFLADVAKEWEEATAPAREAGIRVAHPRFGLILTTRGGALATMLPLFQLGLGGRLGTGEQIWSWITLSDVLRGISHLIWHTTLSGPFNFAAPGAVSNAEFTRVLGRVIKRPTVFAVPDWALRMVMREMADELLLSGVRAVPRKLLDSGYQFLHPELEPALRTLLAGK